MTTLNTNNDLSAFFNPSSIAIFGSLSNNQAPGFTIVKHLQDFGFKGKIYPVNTSCSEVLGIKVYSDLKQVPNSIELALIVIPPPAVPVVVEKCADKGIKSVVIMTENFAEAGDDGIRLQKQVVEIARSKGVRIIGPNTIGILNTASGLITTPYFMGYDSIQKGSIAYCCQSGLMSNVVHPLEDLSYPISKICDFGNKSDLNEVDLLYYLADDPETKVISMHLEDIKDGRAFMKAAGKAVSKKPVLVLKPGRSQAAAKASASHTGSIAANDVIIDAAFKQAGVIRLNTWQEYWDIPRVFASQPLPRGNRMGIVAMSGGAGVLAVDSAVACGMEVVTFTKPTLEKLAELIPRMAKNPVDMGPLMTVSPDPLKIPEQVLTLVIGDENVDCIILLADWVVMQTQLSAMENLHRLIMKNSKPATVFLYGSKQDMREELVRGLTIRGIATYMDLETSVKALGVAARYARIKRMKTS